ncbi:MAG: tRNA pseudouridine(55) synthase TruB [bacterium]|nr:tRNA pseudouridine(55) synthase TruB [bacterium]
MNLKPGIYNIYKPAGPTSHDIVDQVRKISGEKRVGHAGTLDPFAEGILIIAIGREYTKKLDQFLKQDKTYHATLRLGAVSDTHDLTGKIYPVKSGEAGTAKRLFDRVNPPTRKQITEALKKFKGEIEQTPPSFSAIKLAGQRSYILARKGITPKLQPRKVKVYTLKIVKYRWPHLEIETKVSSGTYIRALAHDLGQTLGTGAYLEKLIRTKIGRFKLDNSLVLDKINIIR